MSEAHGAQRRSIEFIAAAAMAIAVLVVALPAFPQTWQQPGNGNIYCTGCKVGVGTSTPPQPLSVYGGGANGYTYLDVTNFTTSLGYPAGLNMSSSYSNTIGVLATTPSGHYLSEWSFRGVDQGLSFRQAALMDVLQDGAAQATGVPGMFQFNTSTGSAAGPQTRMVIKANGNVGIGTTTPTSLLTVAGAASFSGDVTVSGNIAAKYQDIAEWVPTNYKLTAGTVVVLDKEHNNNVLASSSPYDTGVAGVISETPGIVLGEKGEGKVKVATTGRVRVKVDATSAAIHVGDLLVTSDNPGVAMKSQPIDVAGTKIHRPGTIIGKALEPLPSGRGEVLALLTLQ